MRLVVDASTLVAEALRVHGRLLLEHPDLDLFITSVAWSETEHELPKRMTQAVLRGSLDSETAAELLNEALSIIASCVAPVQPDYYADRLDEARRRIPRDPTDAPTVALALALDCGIWTGDHDFFGCGVAVWVTETLQLHLASQSQA